MRKFPFLLILFFLAFAIVSGCKEDQKVDIFHSLDSSTMPTMSTRNIATLISDSGITQYKIIAPLWNIYDEAEVPYWDFPEGIYLQKYDPKYNVIATVGADTAWYYKNERLWKLVGNVELYKKPDELILSPRVFWDQRKQRLYSDTFIHIENKTHVIEGTGFESDENLNNYRILHPTGIFPIDRAAMKGQPGAAVSPAPVNPVPAPTSPVAPQSQLQSQPQPEEESAPGQDADGE